jgi:hypothetical protein
VRNCDGLVKLLRLWRLRRFTLIHSAKAVSWILISARALDAADEGLEFMGGHSGNGTGGGRPILKKMLEPGGDGGVALGAALHVGDGYGDVFHWFLQAQGDVEGLV